MWERELFRERYLSMPFTPAHPAAILPLVRPLRRWNVPSALVIGSMAPDLAYFLPVGVSRLESHSLGGLFWFCLPVGFLAYLIYHLILKRPLFSLLHDYFARRLCRVIDEKQRLPAVSWLAVATSIVVGALTHLAWDTFTHDGAPGVEAIPFLRADLFAVGTYHVYAYRASILQFGYRTFDPRLVGLSIVSEIRQRACACCVAIPISTCGGYRQSLRDSICIRIWICVAMFITPAYGSLPGIGGGQRRGQPVRHVRHPPARVRSMVASLSRALKLIRPADFISAGR